jgi:hypothetical protein
VEKPRLLEGLSLQRWIWVVLKKEWMDTGVFSV